MDKIQPSLKNQCLADPQRAVKVIVTGFVAPEKATQMGLNSTEGLDNIYSGSLTGKDILAIEKLNTVDSIELDGEMNIL